jgi:hypothetical protein
MMVLLGSQFNMQYKPIGKRLPSSSWSNKLSICMPWNESLGSNNLLQK